MRSHARTLARSYASTLILLSACAEESARDTGEPAQVAARNASPSSETASAIQAGEPAKEQWDLAEVTKRLTEGGLVVTDSGRRARQSGISIEGRLLHVGGSELQLYIYPNSAARRQDSDRLDRGRLEPRLRRVPGATEPRVIASGNLLAVHFSAKERTAERVRLVLEAFHVKE